MAGILKTNAVQLGDSTTATQNLTIRTNVDGTFTLARGNVGATTQDVLTIDANGRIAQPQTVVAFSAYQSTLQSIPNGGALTQVNFQTVEYDTTGAYTPGTGKFQPTVPGYYSITAAVGFAAPITAPSALIHKNGVRIKDSLPGNASVVNVAALVYLNGTTDYITIFTWQAQGSAQNTSPAINQTYFQGCLLAKA